MERLASTTGATVSGYVNWEEVYVSTDEGRREVRYYLKKIDGSLDLVAIGKERSLKHMTYHLVARSQAYASLGLKLKSRREVVEWLNSIVLGSSCRNSLDEDSSAVDVKHARGVGIKNSEAVRNMSQLSMGFSWLGSSTTCRKKRRHYQSFQRNGVKISVHDFVYVLAEEHKRLIAYLEDLYEDSRGNKIAVVRWFHKVDEVGIVFGHSFNDREIFFSLCLQDLSIECIDGLATVLSPQDFRKFQNEASHTLLKPYLCKHQFENDEIQPFDITQLEGYRRQEIVRDFYKCNDSKSSRSSHLSDSTMKADEERKNSVELRSRKRLRLSRIDGKCSIGVADSNLQNLSNSGVKVKGVSSIASKQNGAVSPPLTKETCQNSCLKVSCQVEVLSQDSGIKGCWFRALITKISGNKMKVQYQDLADADDEAKKVEVWILASKVAVPDDLGIRVHGRSRIRPAPHSNQDMILSNFAVGSIVDGWWHDGWWHDGWWEGIVVDKDGDNFRVYFPGEKQISTFRSADLRQSLEWTGDEWKLLNPRPELVPSILLILQRNQVACKSFHLRNHEEVLTNKTEDGSKDSSLDAQVISNSRELGLLQDLAKDYRFPQLRWKSSRKRKSISSSFRKTDNPNHDRKSLNVFESHGSNNFVVPSSAQVDHEDCKYGRGSSILRPCSNLVMCS